MKTFQTLAELSALVGQEVALSDWVVITQERVDQFAQATGDHQWIHVDVPRAQVGLWRHHRPWFFDPVPDSAFLLRRSMLWKPAWE